MLRGEIVLVEISGLWLAKCGKKGFGRSGHLHLGSPPIWLQIHLVGGGQGFHVRVGQGHCWDGLSRAIH